MSSSFPTTSAWLDGFEARAAQEGTCPAVNLSLSMNCSELGVESTRSLPWDKQLVVVVLPVSPVRDLRVCSISAPTTAVSPLRDRVCAAQLSMTTSVCVCGSGV